MAIPTTCGLAGRLFSCTMTITFRSQAHLYNWSRAAADLNDGSQTQACGGRAALGGARRARQYCCRCPRAGYRRRRRGSFEIPPWLRPGAGGRPPNGMFSSTTATAARATTQTCTSAVRCVPQSPDKFAAKHWETSHLLVRANPARRAFFDGCFDQKALCALLEQREAGEASSRRAREGLDPAAPCHTAYLHRCHASDKFSVDAHIAVVPAQSMQSALVRPQLRPRTSRMDTV